MEGTYAEARVYPGRIEITSSGVGEVITITQLPGETWHHLIAATVDPAVRDRGWCHNGWHSPRQAMDLLASAFLWKP
jgi:hypothetical protein